MQVGSIATLIASAIAYDHVKDLPNRNNVALNNLVQSVADINYRSFVFNSIAGGATGIGISILVLIYEMLPIILRFLNIGLINYKIKIFLGIVRYSMVNKSPIRPLFIFLISTCHSNTAPIMCVYLQCSHCSNSWYRRSNHATTSIRFYRVKEISTYYCIYVA